MTTLQRDWDLCVSCVAREGGPIYFCSESALRAASGQLQQLGTEVFPWKLSFALTAYNPGDVPQSGLKNAVAHEQLKKDLEASKPDGVVVMDSFSYFPCDPEGLERGVFMPTPPELASVVEGFAVSVAQKYGQAGYFRYEAQGSKVDQELISVAEGKMECSSTLVLVAPPTCHPAFTHSSSHTVFQDISKVRKVLSEVAAKKWFHL